MEGVGAGRLRGGVLAGLAVLLVVAGGAWWRAAAPGIDPTGGPARPSAVDGADGTDGVGSGDSADSGDGGGARPGQDVGPARAASPGRPTGRETYRVTPGAAPHVIVDSATGQVVFSSPRRTVVLDGPTGRVLTDDTGGSVPFDRGGDPAGFGTLWQARLTLRPGLPPQQRVVPAASSRPHLLQARCTGPGELLLVAFPFGRRETHRVACDGSSATVLLDGGKKLRFVLAASGDAPVVVDARLAALAF
ncbi:hypothetical protein [Micromonospora carbonacea]|uniref:Uncharacterized protein n=1 Tax=Micromonospora carbonacea TaxID=47853 RepID=A0A7H8XSK9_9ACTN|nr:hypothetical protein [Micromonospora carbonacea]MBB5823959.1 hypothetical protein [Micromonospora carbonacea]QLD27775.1 hypothetical protein HXZ27_29130 [Micromonospora carbonacea]